jgi:tRNA G46 methylase TrmB
MKKKKTVEFSDEDVVISKIVSVKAYEKAYKGYVEVKTDSREYVEEFEEDGYSLTKAQVNATMGLARGTALGEKYFGKLSEKDVEKADQEFEKARERLHERVMKRRDEILNLL